MTFARLPLQFQLGIESMDATHDEFLMLLDELNGCENVAFVQHFERLISHTEKHFEDETALMDNSDYKGSREHKDEHHKVLFEMNTFCQKAKEGKFTFAKSYASQRIPEWFEQHARTMDSDLAAHLKN